MKLEDKTRMARVFVYHMVEKTYWMELILMFEKKCTGKIFGRGSKKTKVRLGFESATCRFGRFCMGASFKNFVPKVQISFENRISS